MNFVQVDAGPDSDAAQVSQPSVVDAKEDVLAVHDLLKDFPQPGAISAIRSCSNSKYQQFGILREVADHGPVARRRRVMNFIYDHAVKVIWFELRQSGATFAPDRHVARND